ncbi:hypothetical protein [Pseudonocardia xishanensis]|uniref:Uncharacterized protein n=1 Tax=Pseudonocardia xishanensis TaxID=630995 RepID=A0ABP8RZL0_9PSEU
MVRIAELEIDVSRATGLGEPLHTAVTVACPDVVPAHPLVCFAFPGAGYGRGYFSFDMPDSSGGGQAGHHAAGGWIVVACDHLGVGDSSTPANPAQLTLDVLAAANAATVETVSTRLQEGRLLRDLPPLASPTRIGIGQSMGGAILIVHQGRHATFDAIAVLGFSAYHTVIPRPPGMPAHPGRLIPRGALATTVIPPRVGAADPAVSYRSPDGRLPPHTWAFHHEETPLDVVTADLVDYPTRGGVLPPWASATVPPAAFSVTSPGVVSLEASVIECPVLLATGERDTVPQPRMEPLYYESARDVTVSITPRMAHMHNFAPTRELLWSRLETWGAGVALLRGSAASSQRAAPTVNTRGRTPD